jgi:hypothetical protein
VVRVVHRITAGRDEDRVSGSNVGIATAAIVSVTASYASQAPSATARDALYGVRAPPAPSIGAGGPQAPNAEAFRMECVRPRPHSAGPVGQAADENRSAGNGSRVTSPAITVTLLPASREASFAARSRSSSTAVTRAAFRRRTSVVSPGPGPTSSRSSPSSWPSSTQGSSSFSTRRAHSGLEQNSRCALFTGLQGSGRAAPAPCCHPAAPPVARRMRSVSRSMAVSVPPALPYSCW